MKVTLYILKTPLKGGHGINDGKDVYYNITETVSYREIKRKPYDLLGVGMGIKYNGKMYWITGMTLKSATRLLLWLRPIEK